MLPTWMYFLIPPITQISSIAFNESSRHSCVACPRFLWPFACVCVGVHIFLCKLEIAILKDTAGSYQRCPCHLSTTPFLLVNFFLRPKWILSVVTFSRLLYIAAFSSILETRCGLPGRRVFCFQWATRGDSGVYGNIRWSLWIWCCNYSA